MEELSTCSTKILSKVTLQHIQLTPYSVMTVAIALRRYGGDEASETANFCSLWDQFFDCFNTRHMDEASRTRKPFLKPYREGTDERFQWLENVYSLNTLRNGKKVRRNVLVIIQKLRGKRCSSLIKLTCVKFLLGEGMEYVLLERFCQDVLEEYFGNQRKLGVRNDNPDI